MRKFAIELTIVGLLVSMGIGVWAGQQRTPDLYLQEVRDRGVLRVGIDPTYPPFESVQEGEIQGYDVELARSIASELGVRLELVPLALDTLYDALAAERVDMLISALPFVYERQTDVRYSVPYYQSGQVIVVRADDSAIAFSADLAGKLVSVELGSNADTEARRLSRTTFPTMQVRSIYHSPEEALDALPRGEVDAAIVDNTSAQAYLRDRSSALTILSPPLTDEPYVVAMPARATGLSASVDATIERLRASGELAQIMGLAASR